MADTDKAQMVETLDFLNERMTEIANGSGKSLAPLLPLLSFEGRPLGLDDHLPFYPLFSVARPKRRLLKCARRVGKTVAITADAKLRTVVHRGYKVLYVTPLRPQVRRISVDHSAAYLANSPLSEIMIGKGCDEQILRRTYLNGSREEYSYAYQTVDRIRSMGADDLRLDEVQGISETFVPVIGQTMKGSHYGFYTFSGTPLSTENLIETLWDDSSQGEWVVPCSCGKQNMARLDADLLKMIGKTTCVCAACDKPLDCRSGYWHHLNPHLRHVFAGYHQSQITHPFHYENPNNWREILYEQEHLDWFRFVNEILGESFDSADMPLTRTELENACRQYPNTVDQAKALVSSSADSIMAIDWKGSGADGTSTTVVSVFVRPTGRDVAVCAYMERFPLRMTESEEVAKILWLWRTLRPQMVAHDYGGAGNLREAMLVQEKMPPRILIPYTYDFAPTRNIIRPHPAEVGTRSYYALDKARSLSFLCQAIRTGKVLFPSKESCWPLLLDFLNLRRERHESPRGGDYVLFHTKKGSSDDATASVNYAVSSLWYRQGAYPQMFQANSYDDDDGDEG